MDLELAGKTAIVTGGSRGIGKAIARELAREGVRVAIVARDAAALDTAAADIKAETRSEVVPIAADTGSDSEVQAMVARAVEALGGVDILVNAAAQPGGQAPPPKLAEIDDAIAWPDLNVKVLGYLRCIREVAPHMAARGGGRIVNIAGLATKSTGSTVGSIRNVAVAALTKNVADELAAQHITAVVVHPATTRTERTPAVIDAMAKRRGVPAQEIEAQMNSSNLLGRLVDAKEVAYVVAFLCSPKAVSINGDAVVVGGGIRGA
ncbi:MAG TPA: SDR family NAD(P)-dependent oxidoreductase, partial [Candidatus Nitrosotalea sp.]|nr:SDR family NAD(P)-dependent oxidoreductase [Candidatus Nitrosotalea sp.]